MFLYKSSGGGITATGGEPLQAEFVKALFTRAKDELGLNTTLDTSGFAEIIRQRNCWRLPICNAQH